MSDTLLQPPRGMRDFYPDDMHCRNALFKAWRTAAQQFGFVEYDSCVVESLDLLKRKAGEEISDQLYTFKDKSDRDLALRAEMTPTLARMVAARQSALALPLKWFAIPQCFRYERMTKGRKREHYQWNLDILGEEAVTAEVEIIAAAARALELLGLGAADVQVRINSRALLSDLLNKFQIESSHHTATFLALDKRGKLPDEEIHKLLRDAGLSDDAVKSVSGLMALKSLDDVRNAIGADTPSFQRVSQALNLLGDYGLREFVRFDISVIRGLGYYTGIVFEAFDTAGQSRAIFGGGRYDNLLNDIGGKPLTAVGLGFGDVVVSELLAEKGVTFPSSRGDTIAIGYMEEPQRSVAVAIAAGMRSKGRSVDLALRSQKPKSFFSYAGGAGLAEAIFLGPDEVAKGIVRIKKLSDRTETQIPLAELVSAR